MNNKNKIKTPSKRIVLFLGVIILFFVAFFGYGPLVRVIKNTDFRGSLSYNSGLSGALGSVNSVDSDNDNLFDWQEALWRTDPHNPDTDKDGTPDGEEVAAGRDPTKPGPDDKITHSLELTASADSGEGYTNDPNNASQQLSQSLFSQFMAAQTNGAIDDTTQAQIINNTLSNLKPETIPNRYAISDVKVFDSGDTAKTKDFGNNFMRMHQDIYEKITPLTSNDQAIALYIQLSDELSALPVPTDMGLNYLTLLNNYYALAQLSKTEQDDTSDPVKALMAIKSDQDLSAKNQELYTQFASYFKNNGIIWNNNEPGYAWNNF